MNTIRRFICLIFCLLIIIYNVNSDRYNCEPGKPFKELCNSCVCGGDGISATCTKIGCLAPGSKDFQCVPGERFNHECNRCICNMDGITASCTEIHCPY